MSHSQALFTFCSSESEPDDLVAATLQAPLNRSFLKFCSSGSEPDDLVAATLQAPLNRGCTYESAPEARQDATSVTYQASTSGSEVESWSLRPQATFKAVTSESEPCTKCGPSDGEADEGMPAVGVEASTSGSELESWSLRPQATFKAVTSESEHGSRPSSDGEADEGMPAVGVEVTSVPKQKRKRDPKIKSFSVANLRRRANKRYKSQGIGIRNGRPRQEKRR